MAVIPPPIVDLLATGVAVQVGTRDASLMPECTRAWGIRVEPDLESVTLFLTETASRKTLENLRDNGLIAVTCCRPTDHVTCQLKGRVRRIRAEHRRDREDRLRWKRAFLEELMTVGVPAEQAEAFVMDPAVAVEVTVADVFAQTPGPGAGERV